METKEGLPPRLMDCLDAAAKAMGGDCTAGGHTPGPWSIGALESGQAAVDGANGEEVTGFIDTEDARLIAAAPDLLIAIENLIDYPGEEWAVKQARVAIARARGQS